MNRDELLRRYPAHRRTLVAGLTRLVGAADAEDIAEETLLRALSAVEGFRGEAALGTWLHRIGTNLAYDLMRKRGRNPVLSGEQLAEMPEATVEADDAVKLEQQRMAQCINGLLAKLPAGQRQMLVQADMLDRTVQEIAQEAGITLANAKIRLHRARRSMRVALEAHCTLDHRETDIPCCVPKAGR